MTRRELLLLPGVCSMFGQEMFGQELSSSEPQVLSTTEPLNFTFPLEGVAGSVTPADRCFVRDHFREPELSLSSWRLKVEGRVERRLDLTAMWFGKACRSPAFWNKLELRATLELYCSRERIPGG